ncbi:SusC/RagA family TonB-linked outer membrane protein [Bacteroides sp. 51]|uniref:SusC/RagA family TonB-linked outer membrane protein n=1 Tax=Bacteroides sp. 51 TaxID=2302938 RepID=UPI001EF2239F|nr:SusC/RagA family TonB-linked outer membrane protein [Bacteroides sp. 51]
MKQHQTILAIRKYYERYFALILLLFCVSALQAQNRTLKGRVTDETGEPLIGASVMLVGGTNGTVTDFDGNYSIQIADNAVLKYSFIGYKPKSINVGKGKTVLNVTLEEDAIMLEQTVVVAMDMRRDEKSLSTAYQKVDTEGMQETRDANFLNMLSGKVAGLQVISNGPVGSASVVIRGMNSITGNNQPLYVIDGLPIINDVDTGEAGLDYGNPAASLNPDDIESMTVLKGANASALYGSDAANGAIIITTKKASQKRGLGVTYSTNLQFSTLQQYPIYQNVYGSGESNGLKKEGFNYLANNNLPYDSSLDYGIFRVAASNQRSWGMPMIGFDMIGRTGLEKQYTPSNTLLDLYSTSHAWTNAISVEKATEMASVRLSYTNVTSDDVMMKQNELKRNIVNLRASFKPIKPFNIDVGVRYTNEKVDNRNARNSDKKNPLYTAAWMPRDLSMGELTPWKKEDGTLISFPGGFVNPMWCLNEISNQDEKNWVLGDITLNYEILQGLKLRTKIAVDYNSKNGWYFVNMYGGPDVENNDGLYHEFTETYKNMTYEAMLSYNKRWKDFNVSAALGASAQDYVNKKITSIVETLLMPDLKSLANNGGTMKSEPYYNAKKKQAIYGTASIGYRDLVYLDFTGRNDWTSTLPEDNRSYFYSSIGASFILTEAFKNIPEEILSFAKFRGSYARVGNDTGFDQLLDGLSYAAMFNGTPWFSSGNKKLNADLKPERTTSYELGADLKFLKNRIGIDFTYYNKTTRDQILNSQISKVSGYNEAVFNAGKVKNWGTELSVSLIPVQTKNFRWESTLNWAKNNSEVLELADGMDRFRLSGAEGVIDFYIEKGHSMGTLYAKMAKMDEFGNVLCNNEGKPLEQADQFLCDVSAKWMGGWRNSFRLGNFSASVLFDFRKGGKIWSSTAHQGTRDGQTIQSLEGRDESFFSQMVLGENGEERAGFLQTQHTTNPNASQNRGEKDPGKVLVGYNDWRAKGILTPNGIFDESVGIRAGQSVADSNCWVQASSYWMNTGSNARYFLYDASFIKLREVSVSYDCPRSLLKKMGGVFQSMKIAFVGRNLGTLKQNTPNGIDPEAASSLGVIQGIERGFSLPTATYGFDFKVTF